MSSLMEDFKAVGRFITPVIVFIGGIYVIINYVDMRIEDKINDPRFINKMTQNIRPSAVFDENDSILADMGAMQFINDIKVKKRGNDQIEITISPKAFLGIAPILSSIDSDYIVGVPKRGAKFDWVYRLNRAVQWVSGKAEIVGLHRFRIEVVK